MATSRRVERAERSGVHLAITVVALVVAVYFALQVLGLLLKLILLIAAVAVAVAAYRVWRGDGGRRP